MRGRIYGTAANGQRGNGMRCEDDRSGWGVELLDAARDADHLPLRHPRIAVLASRHASPPRSALPSSPRSPPAPAPGHRARRPDARPVRCRAGRCRRCPPSTGRWPSASCIRAPNQRHHLARLELHLRVDRERAGDAAHQRGAGARVSRTARSSPSSPIRRRPSPRYELVAERGGESVRIDAAHRVPGGARRRRAVARRTAAAVAASREDAGRRRAPTRRRAVSRASTRCAARLARDEPIGWVQLGAAQRRGRHRPHDHRPPGRRAARTSGSSCRAPSCRSSRAKAASRACGSTSDLDVYVDTARRARRCPRRRAPSAASRANMRVRPQRATAWTS